MVPNMACNDNLLPAPRDLLEMIQSQIVGVPSCSPCSLNPSSIRSSQTRTISLCFLNDTPSTGTAAHDSQNKNGQQALLLSQSHRPLASYTLPLRHYPHQTLLPPPSFPYLFNISSPHYPLSATFLPCFQVVDFYLVYCNARVQQRRSRCTFKSI